ncbi:conserved oligomeric Golgi complex subunit 8 isoform X1 [Maniola jurtina]|uniref:conserved oligomeric Golgi complex subunit 8 isoform X1 n=1 Tax=Maniola jurtina TaxID=191418 RepID=UPI001E68F053|nr:conserved oligomeric Golgi complex subunit 8 isoform X1 [Maniola jurtina]
MAQELKELCQLLFPDSTTENAEYFSDITEYIKKLGSQNWEHVKKEPERLSEEMKHLTEQTQDLAFTNYKTFVETADISRAIMKDLGKSKESLASFLNNTPDFVSQCESFSQVAGGIVQEKRRYSSIRNQSDKLLELLELPSLMREALNAEDYESALDIFAFIRNLSKRYSEIPIVESTTSEIMTLWYETLYHLFNQLHYDLPLPQCLQILGYLRRANTVFRSTDDEHSRLQSIGNKGSITSDGLHLHFLKARNAWFEKALEDARNTEAPEKLLRKIVELHRIHLFNVITQHKSIFLSDAQESKVRDNELSGTSALSCWLKLKVESLAYILNQDLWREDESGFESIMNQCMYLCLSFGRVGADLRCVLTPLFRNNVLMQFNCGMEKVDNQFENQMKCYKVPSIKNVSRPINENMATGPPENLLDYYPLAEYCNGMLTVLNSLRVTAPLNIVKDVYKGFKKSFEKAAQILITFYHREQQAFTDIEKQNFVSLCVCFTEDLVPYIAKCLSQSFPPTQVAELLGITLTVLQESKILYLDQIEICKPLNSVTGLVIIN